MRSGAKSYMCHICIIYVSCYIRNEEATLVIYDCSMFTLSHLNFFIYEENFILFFYQCTFSVFQQHCIFLFSRKSER